MEKKKEDKKQTTFKVLPGPLLSHELQRKFVSIQKCMTYLMSLLTNNRFLLRLFIKKMYSCMNRNSTRQTTWIGNMVYEWLGLTPQSRGLASRLDFPAQFQFDWEEKNVETAFPHILNTNSHTHTQTWIHYPSNKAISSQLHESNRNQNSFELAAVQRSDLTVCGTAPASVYLLMLTAWVLFFFVFTLSFFFSRHSHWTQSIILHEQLRAPVV